MVRVCFGDDQPWDNHDDITRHARRAKQADGPMAALLQDLKDRDMLKSTIVIVGGEFGFRAVEKPVHPHDLHTRVLHLPGLKHTRLTYRCSGRDFRLAGVAGSLVRDVIF